MNQTVIEILTEEPSMEYFLKVILPKILPDDYQLGVNCFIRPHEGKSDLKKSIPRKIKAFPRLGYPVKVLILHDQDSNDCRKLKNDLQNLCSPSNIPILIRIACRELENWYLGDFKAIEAVYPKVKADKFKNKAKYRDPDDLHGSDEMERLTEEFSKSYASREIPKHMNLSSNNSPSFNQLLIGIQKLLDMPI
jgi:hypothetical protein